MATESGGGRDEIKTHFITREGIYRHCPLSEYAKPNRATYPEIGNTPVSVSFVTLGQKTETPDRICFNTGKELYVYAYKGLKKAADLTLHIEKKSYKGTFPTCHSFNEHVGNTASVPLLVGFSAGQIQLIDPIRRDLSLLFNEERTIDKTKVTCISWLPNSPNQFMVAHASGCLYIYNRESVCPLVNPIYQIFKQGEGHIVYTCKTKSTRNPLFKWMIGEGAIYQFAFSPGKQNLAIVSQDGFLRVFDFHKMELLGYMKSYFGGLHCVSWSPDGKYLVCGGEDDLITVFSLFENRVICRGRGHRSWVTAVAFDPYTTCAVSPDNDEYCSDEDVSIGRLSDNMMYNQCSMRASTRSTTSSRHSVRFDCDGNAIPFRTYRIGSVSQDTNMCLWDITSDVLHSHLTRHRTSSNIAHTHSDLGNASSNSLYSPAPSTGPPSPNSTVVNGTKPRRNFSLGGKDKSTIRSNAAAALQMKLSQDSLRMLGTQHCPKLTDVPLLEPLTCKKLAHSSLTSLFFFKDCLVVACQDGIVSTYARPGKAIMGAHDEPMNSPDDDHTRNGFEESV